MFIIYNISCLIIIYFFNIYFIQFLKERLAPSEPFLTSFKSDYSPNFINFPNLFPFLLFSIIINIDIKTHRDAKITNIMLGNSYPPRYYVVFPYIKEYIIGKRANP